MNYPDCFYEVSQSVSVDFDNSVNIYKGCFVSSVFCYVFGVIWICL